MLKEQNEFQGYSLFSDIEDKQLRNHNRGAVMSNIAEFYMKNKKISPKGANLIIGYMKHVPETDRRSTMQEFTSQMEQRGFLKIDSKDRVH